MTEQKKLLSILSDQPANEDRLNFRPYVQTLTDIITDPGTDTPLTIGIFGDWGRGKTSLMRMVERQLCERGPAEQTHFPVMPVWFNAWLYSRQETLWHAFVARVLQAIQIFPTLHNVSLDELAAIEARLYAAPSATAGQVSLPPDLLPQRERMTLSTLSGLEFLRRRARHQCDHESVEKLSEVIADVEASEARVLRDRIIALDLFYRYLETLCREYVVRHGRLVIFVDDLDRCPPEDAIEALEAIKVFLSTPGLIFIIGVDLRVLEEGVQLRYLQTYGEKVSDTVINGARYLEKIIQIPLNLPLIQPRDIENYVARITADHLPDPRCQRVFAVGLEPNPRRIKRTFNVFLLLWRLAQNRPELREIIKPVRLAKIVIIQQHHRRLFELLVHGPHYLIDLERRFREMEREWKGEAGPQGRAPRGPAKGEDITAGPLQEFLGRSLLRDLLVCTAADEPDANFIDLKPAQVAEYLFLTRSTSQEMPQWSQTKRLAFEPQMVTIPAGSFLMGTAEKEVKTLLAEFDDLNREWLKAELPQHLVYLPAYWIARYPITNAEFARFTQDGGYENPDFWTEAGWREKEREGWTQPRTWNDDTLNDPAQPVVGISWYEAVAYCNWLAAKTGKPYRLASEAEWEKAARGVNGQRFPWGNKRPTPELCNFGNHVGQPTPVGQYSPQGDSPYGCADMVGNVWEWTRSLDLPYPYDAADGREDVDLEGNRVLRGGAFFNREGHLRCAFRDGDTPHYADSSIGFRVVLISETEEI